MIDIADSIHPGFRDALEEVEVATPLTHMNYLEIEVLSKYGNDFTDRRGTVKATVDLYHPKELKLRVSAIINETPSTKTIFVCGPEAMYSFCLKELEALGLRKKQIRVEAYGPPGDVTAEPGWPEGLSGDAKFKVKISDGRTLEVRAGEPLICSLERHHLALPAGCRSGECSYCRAKLLSGTVFHAQGTGLRKSDLQFGYIHPCMAYPIEDLEIRADFR